MSLTQLGRYKITGVIGRGAMGVVYQAHDPLIERTVAIKTVERTGLSREEAEGFELRFDREVKAAGRLNHPNIITIYDVGRSDDLSYVAMELLIGRTLREILDSSDLLPIDRIASIAAQIADGLAYAHANGVVHRDIKPANIMVLENDAVKIADFGVALLSSGAHTVAGTAFGSPKYMSPEQVTGEVVDGRSDIFSLGAVLYEMLAGRPPFAGADLNAVLYQVLNSAPPLPSTFNPGLLHGFDRIVARALAKNPDKRYQNAREMASDLRKYRRLARQEQKRLAAEAAEKAAEAVPAPAGAGDMTVPVALAEVPDAAASGHASSRERRHGHSSKSRRTSTSHVPDKSASRVWIYGVLSVLLAMLAFYWGRSSLAPPSVASAMPQQAPVAAEVLQAPAKEPVVAEAPVVPAKAVEPKIAATPAVAGVRPEEVPVPTEQLHDASQDVQEAVAPAPEEQPASAPASDKPAPAAEGRVRLAVAPWGEVFVDGKRAGVSPPLTELRLTPGSHRIEVRNGDFKPYRQRVDLADGRSVRIKHKFE